MNNTLNLRALATSENLRLLGAPIFIIVVLSMMVLPLPPFALDLFFTFNISLAVMVLLVAMYTKKPLDFSIFPTVLLVTTLLRLALNVASTRIVLLEGHSGPDAAGKVIEAFGHFLVGGNTAIGLVVFGILVLINFVVITKGAGRIAEVSARFALDAMPGKQMAIDADLNAGLINEDEAKRRRKEVSQQSDFFGAMDGASKFVRGDAIAGILILLINIIGGLFVGMMQHDLPLGQAVETYTLLTIGDGLVAQIPALIISVAAGLVVSRVGDEGDIGGQVIEQVFSNPRVLMLTAGIIGVLGLIPGMPNLVFILIAGAFFALAWQRHQAQAAAAAAEEGRPARQVEAEQVAAEAQEASWGDVQPVDVLGLEVGYRLIPLVDRTRMESCCAAFAACARSLLRRSVFCRLRSISATTLNSSPMPIVSCSRASRSVGVKRGRGNIWRSTPDRCRARLPGVRRGIRLSTCLRTGSSRRSVNRHMRSITRWWMPVRSSRPISIICCWLMPQSCSAVRKPSNCWTTLHTIRPSWWKTSCRAN